MGKRLMQGLLTSLLATLMFGLITTAVAQQRTLGILNQEAPPLGVSDWFQLPEGKTRLDIGDLKGKVVYLYCFQSW